MKRMMTVLLIGLCLVIVGLGVALSGVVKPDVSTGAKEDPCGGVAQGMRLNGRLDTITSTLRLIPPSVQPTTQADPASAASLNIPLPDLQYLPIYTDVLSVRPTSTPSTRRSRPVGDTTGRRSFSYEANAPLAKVFDYYEDVLPQYGWEPLQLPLEAGRLISTQYIWRDKTGSSPWHLRLELDLEDKGIIGNRPPVTRVHMGYQRMPNIEDGLPLLDEATDITMSCAEERAPASADPETGSVDVVTRTVTLAYTVPLAPDKVAEYYNSYLPQYGWGFVYADGRRRRASPTPTASITSEAGIPFRASLYAPFTPLAESYRPYALDLRLTASPLDNGQTRVQMLLTKR